MKNQLEPLAFNALTQLEAGEIVDRSLALFEQLPPASPKTDVSILTRFVNNLTTHKAIYFKSLVHVQGSSITNEVAEADVLRDRAITAFRKALKLGGLSLNEQEVEAAHHIMVCLKEYKGIERLNYEAETLAIDKLVSELESTSYAPQVVILNLQGYVNRIKESALRFKALSHERFTVQAQKEVFDARKLRAQLLNEYKDMCLYVAVTASATSDPYFANVLTRINTIRKHYADMLAQRKGVAAARRAAEGVTDVVSKN